MSDAKDTSLPYAWFPAITVEVPRRGIFQVFREEERQKLAKAVLNYYSEIPDAETVQRIAAYCGDLRVLGAGLEMTLNDETRGIGIENDEIMFKFRDDAPVLQAKPATTPDTKIN